MAFASQLSVQAVLRLDLKQKKNLVHHNGNAKSIIILFMVVIRNIVMHLVKYTSAKTHTHTRSNVAR